MPFQSMRSNLQLASVALATIAAIFATGCAANFSSVAAPQPQKGVALHGLVHGGQQPVSQSAIHLYAAGTNYVTGSGGYTGTNKDLLYSAVLTDGGGSFNITGDYSCTAGQQIYIVAVGGYPAGINNPSNPNITLVAALGDCSTLSSTTDITINEITTVAAAYALAPFMTSYASAGTSPANASGLTRAFINAAKLANTVTGTPGGPALAAGATAPLAQIDMLANVLAACVNSAGGSAGDQSTCGNLFQFTTPASGSAPADTLTAAINIAHYPTVNVTKLFNIAVPSSPFPTLLPEPPTDWTLAISYATPGLNRPKTTTIDATGNIWIANSGNNTLTVLGQTGAPVTNSPFTSNGLNAPSAIAIDSTGYAWIANQGSATVSAFTLSGSAVNGSPFGGTGTINAAMSIAIDAPGNIWVANSGSSSLTELHPDGTFYQQVSTGQVTPTSLAINPK